MSDPKVAKGESASSKEVTTESYTPTMAKQKEYDPYDNKADKGKILVKHKDTLVGYLACSTLMTQTPSIKLDRNNFLLWKSIIMPLLRSHRIVGYLDGTIPKPNETISIPPSEDDPIGFTCINPEVDVWEATDQLLVSWLYNSMTPEMAAQVMGYDTAATLWKAIEDCYGNYSKSQEDHNRQMLQQTRKGGMKMEEYLTKMKSYHDKLTLAGRSMDLRTLISYVLAGLDEEYNPIVCVLRSIDIEWLSLQHELISYEQRQEKLQQLKGKMSINQVSINVVSLDASQEAPGINLSSFENGGFQGGSHQPKTYQTRNIIPEATGGKWKNKGRYSPYNKVFCQLCKKPGHEASNCYYRYEPKKNSAPNPTQPAAQPLRSYNGTTLMAYPETLQDPGWFLDSGASDHVTSHIGRLNLYGESSGQGEQGNQSNRKT